MTKPTPAGQMVARALDADVPAGWVTADEVSGGDPGLRADLQRRRIGQLIPFIDCQPGNPGAQHRSDALSSDRGPGRTLPSVLIQYHQL